MVGMIVRKAWVQLLFVGLTVGCGDSASQLSGSISQRYSLEFDRVTISKAGCNVRIDYIKDWNAGRYVQCRVAINSSVANLHAGVTLSGDTFLDAVTVSRINPTGRNFPEVTSGELTLDRYGFAAGDECQGSFSLEFADSMGNALGRFRATLSDARPTETCD